jgi:hypothetical protein
VIIGEVDNFHVGLLVARCSLDQKTSKFFVFHWDTELGKGNTEGSMLVAGGIRRQSACFSSPGAFKTYTNLREGKNQMIPVQ